MNPLNRTLLIAAASLMVSTSAFALTATESQALVDKILASKVIDMPSVAAKMVVKAEKAERIETAKTAVVAVAKNYPKALSAVVGAVVRKAPETTEAVLAACLEAAPSMARTVVAAATFASVGQDKAILSVIDRLAPAQQQEVKTEMALALTRRIEAAGKAQGGAGKTSRAIIIPGSNVETKNVGFNSTAEAEETFARILLKNVDPKAVYDPESKSFSLPSGVTATPGTVTPDSGAVNTSIGGLFTESGLINGIEVIKALNLNFKPASATKGVDANRETLNLYASP